MNKKILAGLMSLGLILGPIGNGQALATEAKTYDQGLVDELILYTSLDESQIGPLDDELKNEFLTLQSDAEELLNSDEKTDDQLEEKIELFGNFLARAAGSFVKSYTEDDLKNYKERLIVYKKIYDNYKKNLDKENQTAIEKNITWFTFYLAEATKEENKVNDFNVQSGNIEKYTQTLKEAIIAAKKDADKPKNDEEIKAIFEKESSVTKEEIKALDPVLEAAHKKLETLRNNKAVLLDDEVKFKGTEAYKKAETGLKVAYDNSIASIKEIKDLDEIKDFFYDYELYEEYIEKAFKARTAISDKDLKKSGDKIEIIKNSTEKSKEEQLRDKIQEGKKELENPKISQERRKALKESIEKAEYLLAPPPSDDDEMEKAIKDLDEKIRSAKESEKDTDDVKKLKDQLAYAKYLKENIFYQIRPTEAKDGLNKSIKESEDLLSKDNPDQSAVKKALDKLNSKIDDVVFTNPTYIEFAGSAQVEKDLKALVDSKSRLESLDAYKNAADYDKMLYKKALDAASELLKGPADKKTSKNLKEKYTDLYRAIENLQKTTMDKLKDLVNDDPYFRLEKAYTDAEKDSAMNDALENYKNLIKQAKDEIYKIDPNQKEIERIYKSLKDSRDEIEKKISTIKRKILAEIYLSEIFKDTDEYKNAEQGKNKKGDPQEDLKEVWKEYNSLLEKIKELRKADKLDSAEAIEVYKSLKNAREYIYGDISKEFYLVNKYHQILNAMTKYPGYDKEINQQTREKIKKALELAEKAMADPNDKDKTAAAYSELDAVMRDDSVRAFIEKMKKDNNPNKETDNLRTNLKTEIDKDYKEKNTNFKYSKAQKAFRDAYDLALANAKKVLDNPLSSEDDLRSAYNKLVEAGKNLDGDLFQSRILALAEKFKKEQLMIKDPNQRQAIAEKINKLGSDPTKTMDDVIAVEKEFESLKTQITTTTVPTNQASGIVTTTTPMQENKNPASIVKTGIESIGKFAIILVAAAIILIIMNKKGEKNENNK